ncbi:uncharacterized protein LOC133715850 isoform X2 [Rosa rugosa]|uniref:uncharacterized protein LOC133715850 isoform X2 n=1 Tax=Rosa rugosa TaxID=74645 RepID=UPI002B413DD3|nr:uncharacterized protein LOC133715850 isoform X2 [Rosa rugosa]
MLAADEAGTMDEEVFKLKEKLSQCQLEREQLLREKESWMIKEQLVMREKEEVEEKLRIEIEANLCARSEFEKKEKPLKEALETKKKSLRQLKKAFNEFHANGEMPYMGARSANANDKLKRLRAELEKKNKCSQAERDKLDKLHSEIIEKRDNLFAFLKTCVKYSKITDDVKHLLRVHYDAYIDKRRTENDDCELLRKYVHFVLQPGSAQKQNEMFAGVDFISPIFAAMSKNFNVFLRKKTEANGSFIYNHKHRVRGREDDESEHPSQASIGKKLWELGLDHNIKR